MYVRRDQLVQLTFTDGASPVLWMPALHLLSVVFDVTFDPVGGVAVVARDALRAFPVSIATSALTKARPTVQRGKWPSFGENFWPKLLLAKEKNHSYYYSGPKTPFI